MLSNHLQQTLERAVKIAHLHHHEFITLEHLLLAFLEDRDARAVLDACHVNIEDLKTILKNYIQEKLQGIITEVKEPTPTESFQRVLQRAAIHAQSSGHAEVNAADLLIALFSEQESYALYALQLQEVERYDVVSFVSYGHQKENALAVHSPSVGTKDVEKAKGDSFLMLYCRDLKQEAAAGKIDPLIGRSKELERTLQILCRRSKNNPLYVGAPGVGKTAIAEGLALRIIAGEVPDFLKDATLFSLDLGSLLAGTRYRGDFEERFKKLLAALEKQTHPILLIDEIHTLIGAGATSSGAMDASNLLKPVLGKGHLRFIGSTTYQEYRNHFEKDRALVRRFQKIDIEEPSAEDTVKILEGLRPSFEEHHQVKYHDDALRAAVELSSKFIPSEHKQPDKAIDVMDEAGARERLLPIKKRSTILGREKIESVISKMMNIPMQQLDRDERKALRVLSVDLKHMVYGQDKAVDALTDSIKLSRAGLREPGKPIGSYLFSGPTGVGKTELARQLASMMGIELIRFDMSEYMEKHSLSRLIGTPPGYIGFEQGGLLTDAIDQHPHAVLLLDEFEKAHPDLYHLLLQVMDHGTLTDHTGKKINFQNVILIMTSNAGAEELTKTSVGFGNRSRKGDDLEVIKKRFTPEFRNRLDAIIPFNNLGPKVLIKIVDKFITQLQAQLSKKAIEITLSASAKDWLIRRGYDPLYGARPMQRLIQEEIKKPLAEALLFGPLGKKGGRVKINLRGKKLILDCEAKTSLKKPKKNKVQ